MSGADWSGRLRALGRAVLGARALPLIDRLGRSDPRWTTFVAAMEYLDFEGVDGDILECGVFGGVSLALLARAASFGAGRRAIGVDTFTGLPEPTESHAVWKKGDCAAMHAPHPLVGLGEPVTMDVTRRLFEQCGLPPPVLYQGWFAEVLPTVVPREVPAVALLHVDCDLYESTRDALAGAAPALQDGTMVLFDDWFHYKGHPRRGEARAFREFLDAHPEWEAVHWRQYATFCNAFILSRRA
ncbi:MAG: TylF/MycF/NovP-related O-methyltransferase [Acidobacteriota bacterium]